MKHASNRGPTHPARILLDTKKELKNTKNKLNGKRKNKKRANDVSSSILISSYKSKNSQDQNKVTDVALNMDVQDNFKSKILLSNEEIPPQQIFDVNEHKKYRFLSEVGKRTINGAAGNENLNFVKLPGRKSVKKDEKTPTKIGNSYILPSRLRGNSNVYKDVRKKSMKKESMQHINNTFIDHSHHHNHPMIINQMNEGSNLSRLSDNNHINVLTPKTGVREMKVLKTAKSQKSQTNTNTKVTSENESFSTQIEKTSSSIKKQVAHDITSKVHLTPGEISSPEYQMKVEIEKQKAYIGKLPNGGMITKNLYSEFNDADTPIQAIVDVDRQIMEYNCNEVSNSFNPLVK